MKAILLLLFVSIVLNCSLISKKASASSIMKTDTRKIYIAPILNTANFDSLPMWPVDKKREGILLKKIAGIRKILISKIKQSDCTNTVQIVQNSDQPDYRVSVTLIAVSLSNDSLTIPLRVEIENIHSGSIQSFSMNSASMYRNQLHQDKTMAIDSLFSRYQTSFPFTTIIGYICNN